MSSILDALQKIESAQPPGVHTRPAPTDAPLPRRMTLVALVVAFVAGAGATTWLLGRRSTPPAEPTPTGRTVHDPAFAEKAERPVVVAKVAVAPPVQAPRPVTAPVAAEATLPASAASPAEAAKPVMVAGAALAPAPKVAAPVPIVAASALPLVAPAPPPAADAVPVGRVALGGPAPAPHAEPPPVAPLDVAPAAAPPPEVAMRRAPPERAPDLVIPRPPADAPRVQVSFLVYSRVPDRRSVTLTIEGGSLTTLHEGESADGIEVARILADRVELRHAGKTFVAVPRD